MSVHPLNVCWNSLKVPLSFLFIRTEQHLLQPWRAHLLYFQKGSAHIVLPPWRPWHLLLVPPCFQTSLQLDKTFGGETGRGLWNRTAVLQLLSFTVANRVETVMQQVSFPPPHLAPTRVYQLIALNSFLKSLREPFGSLGIYPHAHERRDKLSFFSRKTNGRFS